MTDDLDRAIAEAVPDKDYGVGYGLDLSADRARVRALVERRDKLYQERHNEAYCTRLLEEAEARGAAKALRELAEWATNVAIGDVPASRYADGLMRVVTEASERAKALEE